MSETRMTAGVDPACLAHHGVAGVHKLLIRLPAVVEISCRLRSPRCRWCSHACTPSGTLGLLAVSLPAVVDPECLAHHGVAGVHKRVGRDSMKAG